jgi:predicted carbohydrate-binding protein with CBM5 and CBM33 domain
MSTAYEEMGSPVIDDRNFELSSGVLPSTPTKISRHGHISRHASRAAFLAQEGKIGEWQVNELEAGKFFPKTQSGLSDELAPEDSANAQPPLDGQIASANRSDVKILDQPGTHWRKHSVRSNQQIEFYWTYTAPHKTRRWNYFITKDGWDPNKPLSRAQFENAPFAQVQYSERPHWSHPLSPNSSNPHSISLPKKKGYHVILAAWEVADSPMAFYQVIDLDFGGSDSGGENPPPEITGEIIAPGEVQSGQKFVAMAKINNPDGQKVEYTWIPKSFENPSGINSDKLTVYAPKVAKDTMLSIELHAQGTGNYVHAKKDIKVIAQAAVTGPGANPGADLTVVATTNYGYAYSVDGAKSTDPLGKGLKYLWTATSGPITLRRLGETTGQGKKTLDQVSGEVIVPKNFVGTGVLQLMVTDAEGRTNVATRKIHVIEPTVELDVPEEVGANASATFFARTNFNGSSTSPLLYQWELRNSNNDIIISTTEGAGQWTVDAHVLTEGKYNVSVRAETESGGRSAVASARFTVLEDECGGISDYPRWPEEIGSYTVGHSIVIGLDNQLWQCKFEPHGRWANQIPPPGIDYQDWPYAPGGRAANSLPPESQAWYLVRQ